MGKYLRTTMLDGSEYDVSVHIIAKERADYYAKHGSGHHNGAEYDRIYKEEYEYTYNDDSEICDWACNNMDWVDVKCHAIKVREPNDTDYQEGWINGEHEVIEK